MQALRKLRDARVRRSQAGREVEKVARLREVSALEMRDGIGNELLCLAAPDLRRFLRRGCRFGFFETPACPHETCIARFEGDGFLQEIISRPEIVAFQLF